MKLEYSYTDLKWSTKLKALGVRQDTANFYYFWSDVNQRFELAIAYESIHYYAGDRIASLSVAELGAALPNCLPKTPEYQLKIGSDLKSISYNAQTDYEEWEDAFQPIREDREANTRAAMLCYLLENGIIKIEEVNARLAA